MLVGSIFPGPITNRLLIWCSFIESLSYTTAKTKGRQAGNLVLYAQ